MVMVVAGLPLASLSQTVVNQLQFGEQVIDVLPGQEILFYDHCGTGNIAQSNLNNAQSLTVFRPMQSDMAIELTFLNLDIQNDNRSWADYPGEVRVFNGNPDPTSAFEWPGQPSEVTDMLPDGDVMAVLDGTYTNKVYVSTTDDGILSVGLIWHYAKSAKGWTAKVRCIERQDMVIHEARTDYSLVSGSPTMRKNLTLAGVIIDTEGAEHADRLTSLSYRMSIDENAFDATKLRLYEGDGGSGTELIGTSPSADGQGYTFTLNRQLHHGTNLFTLVGDLLDDAPIGSHTQVEVTRVTTQQHPDGLALEQGTPVTITTPAIIIMDTQGQEVTVGDVPIMLYDDGGKDGEITAGFNGSVTFVPEDPSKKIQVDFQKIALANGSIYYQYIEVYNGREKKSSQLLKTLRHGETCVVRSSASDGSLTVFLGNNGTQQTADGIEALVTQFVPQPMTLDHVAAEHPTLESVCADDKGQPILLFNVITKDTEPALTADQFTFTTAGTWQNIAAAKLYFAGISNKEKGQLVGTATVSADDFTITPDNPVTLYEGVNYFFLTYDISDGAVEGTTVDGGLTAVTLSGTSTTVSDGNPAGSREVNNTVYCYANQGTQNRTVNGSLHFRTRDMSEYQHLYEAGNDERITIFHPKHEGMVCQIDFSEFGLQYTTSYIGGVKSTFKIISGSNANGPVLWELKDVADKDVGPGHIVRSTASDGSLTILFCPNDWNYNSTGWQAEVSEYLSRPMAVDKVEVTQTTTDIVPNHAKDVDLLTLNITAMGDLSVISLNSINIDTKNSPLSKLSLYYLGRNDGEVTTPAIGTATIEGETTTLTLDTPLQLQEGSNFFRLRADVSDDALGEDVIDACVVSINAGGNDIDVSDGDPDGARTLRDIYLIAQGDNGEIGVGHGQHILFYDDGGEDGKATKNFNGSVTFYPRTEGELIRFDFQQLSLGTKDTLYIYNGGAVSEEQLLVALSGANAQADYFVSSADDGKLTARFVVKSSFTRPDGFAIDVSAYSVERQEITQVSIDNQTPATVLQGSTDVLLYTIGVSVSGEGDKMTLQQIDFDVTGTDHIGRVAVYTTGTDDAFSPTSLFGESTDNLSVVTGNYPFEKDGTYYFHIAVDINGEAPAGSELSIVPTLLTTDRTTYNLSEVTPATMTVEEGFKGTLTVGRGGDYGTIQAAVDAVSSGISGPVTISNLPGIYNETVKVPHIPGASANNPLTIESQTGSWEDVKIYFDHYDEPPYSDDKMSKEFGVFTVAHCDYVTLRGLDITTTDLTFPGVVHITGESRHVTIDHCHIHCASSSSYNVSDIKLINTYAENVTNRNNDFMAVTNCLLEGGYIGIRMGGTGYVVLPKERGGVIENNTFVDQGSKGIYVMEESGVKVRNNTVRTQKAGNNYRGIDFQVRDTYDESAVIEGNHFYISSSGEVTGMHIRLVNGTESCPVNVFNNEVVVEGVSNIDYGMVVNSSSSHLRIAHNTIVVKGRKSGAVFWLNDRMGNGVEMVNNVLQNNSSGYVYYISNASYLGSVSWRHQANHTNGNGFAYIGGTGYGSHAAWVEQSGETDGIDEEVTFLHDEILEPADAGSLVSGEPLSWVSTDICGIERGAQPTLGAYEYQADDRAPVMNDGYPGVTDITDTTARIILNADMNCEAFVLISAGSTTPAIDKVLTKGQTVALHKDSENTFAAAGLETGKTYRAFVVLRSLRGTESILYSTDAFVAEGNIVVELEAPEVTVSGVTTVEQGASTTLTATIVKGQAPYYVTWLNGKHELMGENDIEIEDAADNTVDDLTFTCSVEATPLECDDWQVIVVDVNGMECRDTVRLIVTGGAVAATFENLYLPEDSYWCGTDMSGSFVSGSYLFDNTNMPEWNYWSEFAYANRTETDYVQMYPDQFNNAVGGGHNGSENYAVVYPYGGSIHVMNKDADVINGFYVTNEAWVVDAIFNGDGMTPGAFRTGDYLRMVVTGKHTDGSTSDLAYYLADFRDADETEHYCLDSWQWVDLRPLGEVSTVSFQIESSRSNQYGMTTPGYFCMDDFNGERDIKDAGTVVIEDELALSSLFDFTEGEGRIVYDFADEPDQEVLSALELTPEGTLRVSGYTEPFELVLQGTQRGNIQFVKVRVEITVPSGIDDFTLADDDIESIYTLDGRKLEQFLQHGLYIVKTKDGRWRKIER